MSSSLLLLMVILASCWLDEELCCEVDSIWFHWNLSLPSFFHPNCSAGGNLDYKRNEHQEYFMEVVVAGV